MTVQNSPRRPTLVHHAAKTGSDHQILFEKVCSMEDDIEAVKHFASAIAIMSELIDDDESMGLSFQRLAWEIKHRVDNISERRGELFRMTHPNRQHFEREGWPGQD